MAPIRLILLMLPLSALVLCGCGATAGSPQVTRAEEGPDEGPEPEPPPWRLAWDSLGSSHNTCESFDYYPKGGMRIFYCHLKSVVSIGAALADAPRPIFLSGPHAGDVIDLSRCVDGEACARTFGHYNPAFVRWAGEALIPGADDEHFRGKTQGGYDRYVRGLARAYWMVRGKLASSPACTKRYLSGYRKAMERGEALYYERWYRFLDSSYTHASSGCSSGQRTDAEERAHSAVYRHVNVDAASGAVGFWLRRRIDGTETLFTQALERLLRAYDAKWLARTSEWALALSAAPGASAEGGFSEELGCGELDPCESADD